MILNERNVATLLYAPAHKKKKKSNKREIKINTRPSQ